MELTFSNTAATFRLVLTIEWFDPVLKPGWVRCVFSFACAPRCRALSRATPRRRILVVISHLASFQIVGGTYRRACCCTDRTSWRPTNQAPHGRSLQCRPTDNLRVLQLRAMPDVVPVMNVVMHPEMMDAVLLNRS